MVPIKDIRLALGTILAADTATLAPAVSANKIALVAAAFAPDEDLVIGDVTLATFTGSAAKAGATGAQSVVVDPFTGQQQIIIKEPIGGYVFICTATPADPETIYGFILMNNAGTTLLASALLPTPVTIAEAGHYVEIHTNELTFNQLPIT